ncbi:hypothetical protein [Mesorhizobium sp.]|uniref:hypothetical protein n=1 Tax=Mesorhizobium sp. TaxID=1871066 RepID=UPI0025E00CF5|nr:hypothetical protein [Mesorhizobium sp.]
MIGLEYPLRDIATALDKKNLDIKQAQTLVRELIGELSGADRHKDLAAIANEVESLLRAGLVDDARLRVDRWLHPKWESEEACEEKYFEAMGVA